MALSIFRGSNSENKITDGKDIVESARMILMNLRPEILEPMFNYNSLESVEYDIVLLKWIERMDRSFVKLVMHPIEAGNFIEFKIKGENNFAGTGIRTKNIIDFNILQHIQKKVPRKEKESYHSN